MECEAGSVYLSMLTRPLRMAYLMSSVWLCKSSFSPQLFQCFCEAQTSLSIILWQLTIILFSYYLLVLLFLWNFIPKFGLLGLFLGLNRCYGVTLFIFEIRYYITDIVTPCYIVTAHFLNSRQPFLSWHRFTQAVISRMSYSLDNASLVQCCD